MKNLAIITVTALAVSVGGFLSTQNVQAASEAHAHIGHVMTGWKDTPSGKGLLPTAKAEAKIAADHAGFAAADTTDLKSMKLHAGHVRHAIDPSVEASGPGLGYGLVKAANGTIQHITLASKSGDASESVKTHTVHVVSASNNALNYAKLAMAEADAVLAASNAAEAAPHVKKLAELTQTILSGQDGNNDGKVSWHKDEGGLAVADKHMGFILDGEGLKRE